MVTKLEFIIGINIIIINIKPKKKWVCGYEKCKRIFYIISTQTIY